jgi:hypothetical protein
MSALTVFTITSATGNGTTTTYTGTITSGASPLVSGMPIIVAGFVAQPGFNGTKVINGGNLTTTFTALNATNASETHAATATVDLEGPSVYPTDVASNTVGYGYVGRQIVTPLIDLGNYLAGTSSPGQGQIYPTGRN